MTLVVAGILGAIAVPKMLDLQREGKVASLQRSVALLRTSLQTNLQRGLLKCGVKRGPGPTFTTYLTQGGYNGYIYLLFSLYQNNITYTDGTSQICSTTDIPIAGERKMVDIPNGEVTHIYIGGVDYGLDGGLPKNPFQLDKSYSTGAGFNLSYTTHCGAVATYNASGFYSHWMMDDSTGEIWPGTNTTGINECNF